MVEFLSNMKIDLTIIGGSVISVWTLLYILGLLAAVFIGSKTVLGLLQKGLTKAKVDIRLMNFIMTGSRILLYFIVVIIIMDAVNIPISSLLAAFTACAAAIALALKDSLANVACGILLIANSPFAIGDYIVAGGIEGTVVSIRMMTTSLITRDNRIIHCPNSQLFSGEIINNTAMEIRRLDMTFTVAYEDAVEDVKSALLDAAKADPQVLKDPAPFVGILNFGESNIEYTLRSWIPTEKYWDVYFRLQESVKRTLDERGLTISYNHLNVHVIKDEQ